ncbi:condensin complex subunit 1 [Glomus cerebriforme]|uniref:Condensin complex subunit 1 n=1 Tax=Glomus cerebriforme TaxID=658196 RepID=A0A397TIU8_9GLOM|nr:condensin complex subunit 1 [Glomus cerebriforme]
MAYFKLSKEISDLQSNNYIFSNEVSIIDLETNEIESLLNDIVDKISENSFAITNEKVFGIMCSFVKNFYSLNPTVLNYILDIILSGLKSECTNTSNDLDADNEYTYDEHRIALEMYGFLLYWYITRAEEKTTKFDDNNGITTSGAKTKRARQPRSKSTSSSNNHDWNWSVLKLEVLDLMIKVLELRIKKIWETAYETENFVKLLSICVKEYDHALGAQGIIIQNLQYFEHLSEPMAEFLHTLAQQYNHTQLAESILADISNKEFKSQDTTGPKSYSKFLIKLSALAPKIVIKQIAFLGKFLESDSYTMRCGFIEVIGNLISDIAQQEENTPSNLFQVNGFFDILEERFLDVNSYCRSKVLQVYLKICDLKVKFPKRRQTLANLVIRCLEDKACIVRKNSIKLLTKLIKTHPYGVMHGGELSIEEWEKRLNKVEEELKAIQPPHELVADALEENEEPTNENEDSNNEIEDSNNEIEIPDEDIEMTEAIAASRLSLSPSEELMKLHMTKRYYADAIRFIHQIDTAIPTICQLLGSTTKSEVIEAIEFFETAQLYKIEKAGEGIKKMLHLIWTKDNNDEGKGIRNRLIECYRNLYIEPDVSISEKENVNKVTRNLIGLTYNATLAELISLEQILSTMMEGENAISGNIINKLWSIYSVSTREVTKEQRRGAIIVLNMLAKAKIEIVQEKIDLLLKIGLGQYGKTDLVLAKYTCIALQRLAGNQTKEKGSLPNSSIRLPTSHQIFQKLKQIIEFQTTSQEWFGVTEQAINTIYLLSDHPDILCGDIIKQKAALVFDLKMLDENDMEIDEENILTSQEPFLAHPFHLSQLVFIVGHVAVKQIVHLEIIENELKRRKEAEPKANNHPEDDELDQIIGSNEDEFVEAIAHIRENELLLNPDSLLAVFGPLIINICANNKTYNHRNLQTAATLALVKLMCVSSKFCEDNLQLLFTILEISNEPLIRSNITVALGDIVVCFNNVIDENINYLYKRLTDPDDLVKKNALMVLTHLILNGMIKVKGQLGGMAKCLEDKDQRISELAKLFFTELASKDNAVYNNISDIISNLSSSENPVNEESFMKIMKFLFGFIEKDKQTENVVEKLCQRFKNLDDRRQWRDIAYCLSLLPYKSEKSFKKLVEGMAHYQDKLNESDVHKYFTEIISKVKAIKTQRPEMKQVIEEFEEKIEDHRKQNQEEEETMQKASEMVQKTKKLSQSKKRSPRSTRSPSASTPNH